MMTIDVICDADTVSYLKRCVNTIAVGFLLKSAKFSAGERQNMWHGELRYDHAGEVDRKIYGRSQWLEHAIQHRRRDDLI